MKKLKKSKNGRVKYDALVTGPIDPFLLTVFTLEFDDGEIRIVLWPSGATINEAREHAVDCHPGRKFKIGVVGVGEFLVDRIDHAFRPELRTIDQAGYLVPFGPE